MNRPILIHNARVLTLDQGKTPRRGSEMALLAPIDHASLLIQGNQIEQISATSIDAPNAINIDAKNIVANLSQACTCD